VLAFVLNTLIAVAGLAAFYGVEIRELPDVDRAVVTVTTTSRRGRRNDRPRADRGHRRRGGARLRRQVDLVQSSFGRSRVTIEFNDGVDLNVAASDMRDAVGRVSEPACPTTPTRRASSRPTPTPTP
jgi:HAE1 family hydrophobic/amphiphilic exporter-1